MLSLLFATMLAAQQPAPVAAASPESDRIICKREPILGSRIKAKKTCRTAGEWEILKKDQAQMQRDLNMAAKGPNQQ